MRDRNLLGPWVRRFLLEYLVAERNLARNTQVSYRDTLTLLLPFVSRTASAAIDRLSVEDISPDTVRAFLEYLEHERGCGVVTRNQRLSAIHSLARFIDAITRAPGVVHGDSIHPVQEGRQDRHRLSREAGNGSAAARP